MKLYGKESLAELLSDTAEENRMPHAILLTGERGSGRHTVAKYIAKLFMCGARPCEKCPTCSRINAGAHPDVIDVLGEIGGKYGLTSKNGLTDIREFMDGTAIKPNDGDVKIYVFSNAEEMSAQVQNTLLKNIEEPENWVKYIFICENSSSLLTTIRSRVTEYRIPDCTAAECRRCLEEEFHADPAQAEEYSQMMSGNIGKCVDALGLAPKPEKKRSGRKPDDEPEEDAASVEMKLMESARHAAAAVASRNAYMLCAALGEQSGRKEYAGMLEYFAGILRDALAARAGGGLYSCGKEEARKIAAIFDENRLADMISAVFEINQKSAAANLNLALCSAYLTSRLL